VGNFRSMTHSSDDQTRPACPACGARLDASFDPGDACPHCEDGTLVALPEVMESDLAQQSDVAGSERSDGLGGLDDFSSPSDFAGGLGDQDTTTRSQSLPSRDASVGAEQTATADEKEPGSEASESRRLGQSVSEPESSENPFKEWQESSTAENPSLPEMKARDTGSTSASPEEDAASDGDDAGDERSTAEPEQSGSGGFVPPPSSVVEEMPEEGSAGRGADRETELAKESSAPAPTLPDDESGAGTDRQSATSKSQRSGPPPLKGSESDTSQTDTATDGDDAPESKRPNNADTSGELESALETSSSGETSDRSGRPSAEQLIEEDEEWSKQEAGGPNETGTTPPSQEPSTDPSDAASADQTSHQPAGTASSSRSDRQADGGMWVWLVGGAIGLVAIAVGVIVATGIVEITGGSGQSSSAQVNDPDQMMAARRKAIAEATNRVEVATQIDTSDPELRGETASQLAEAGRAASASRIQDAMWRNGSRSRDFTLKYLDLLIEGERYHRARMIALAGARLHDDVDAFQDRYGQAVEADATLGKTEAVDVGEDVSMASLAKASDIDADALLLVTEEGDKVVFYPETSDQRAWRNHVAAWRLCEVLGCGFEVPWTRKARMTKRRFETASSDGLTPSGGLVNEESADDQLESFRWRSPSGTDTQYLYGALRTWPGEMARWPIEAFEIWRPWMRATRESGALDRPAADAWSAFSNTLDDSQLGDLKRQAGEQTLRSVAAQLSDVLLFDYLTNNWGRFAPESSKYGVNNHFRDGQFVTVDTDQTFQRRHSRRVKGRFSWTEIFREETIFALRWMDREQLLGIVYPEPSSLERAKFDLVWEQRNRTLDRVDKLVDTHGAKSVYPFSVIPLWSTN
jgi:hypothetical protein